ncbi:ATP-binding protein [Nonomuraea sp. NPDC059023]|uniref:ATP-binding protein n=1 Tax=unclassified Nonomuraea TaxID=2593643 RepID=UPI0036A159EC
MDMVLGRDAEMARLTALLDAARQGRGGALVVKGEPGIGKSVLLRQAGQAADGFLVIRATGAQFEMELPFAALHQLCAPLLDHLGDLAPPQRTALEGAFGLNSGTPEPLMVGLGALGLLLAALRERPVLCVVDDAQWLDHASAHTLAFLARRIGTERIAMIFGVREPGPAALADLPELGLRGLSEAEARALLDQAVHAPLDERVRDRILSESRGNPLALLELPRTAGLGGMAGGFDVPAVIEQSYLTRLRALPEPARTLLTVAAAEPVGDAGLLWRAAGRLGITADTAARTGGLADFGTRIRFSHPLARSAVYGAATAGERRRAHAALAEATDPAAEPDRRAWHRAQAAPGPNEEVAAELDASAARAQARGGIAAAAAFLERSAALTTDPAARAERVLAAARAKLAAGAFEVAADLLTSVQSDDPRFDVLRGRLSFARYRGGDDPAAYLLRAARALAETDPARSRACYLDAMEMGVFTGELAAIVEAARSAPPGTGTGTDTVLDGLVTLVTRGHAPAAGPLRPIVRRLDDEVWASRPSLGYMIAAELWDIEVMRGTAERVVATGRESGAFHLVPIGLAMLATVRAHEGAFGPAAEMISEEEAIASATGAAPLVYPRLHLAALRGRREEAMALFADVPPRMSLSAQWAAAVLHNSLADYPAALVAARAATASGDLGVSGLALPELIEAAVRSGRPEPAAGALRELTVRARAAGTAWALGVEAYCRALVTGEEDGYREAVEHLRDSPTAIHRGRAHLLYGEWLRREGRRRDARAQLRQAHEQLSELGAEAFAKRAAGELRGTGEQARSRTAAEGEQLTLQEVHIARLVAEGATSKDVAATLFLSPRTIDAHLRNIFRKLGLTSRRQLRDLPEIH